MTRIPPALLAALLPACTRDLGERPAGAEVSYAGWVFASPDFTEENVLGEGSVVFEVAGADPIEAEQPYADYPGYWRATLPAAAPYEVVIEAASAYPTRIAGDAPSADGSWFGGSLWAGDRAFVDAWYDGLGVDGIPSLDDGGVAHVWGAPYDDGWDCADVRVAGEAPYCFLVDAEAGTLARVTSGEFTYFHAFDVPPGEVRVQSGLGGEEVYQARAGELVLALYFVGNPG